MIVSNLRQITLQILCVFGPIASELIAHRKLTLSNS